MVTVTVTIMITVTVAVTVMAHQRGDNVRAKLVRSTNRTSSLEEHQRKGTTSYNLRMKALCDLEGNANAYIAKAHMPMKKVIDFRSSSFALVLNVSSLRRFEVRQWWKARNPPRTS